jgi:hypothetical protein
VVSVSAKPWQSSTQVNAPYVVYPGSAMTLASEIEILTDAPASVPVRRWPQHPAEYDANFSYSASCYESAEQIGILTMIAFAADRTDDADLVLGSATDLLLGAMAIFVLAANPSLVNFNDTHQLLEILIVHRGPNARAHVPDSLVARLVVEHHALDLECADALLGVEHHKGDSEPSLERILGILENRAGDQREPIAFGCAFVALPVPSAGKLVGLIVIAARASHDAIRPTMLKQEFSAGFFIRKEGVEFAQLDHA